MKLSVVVMAHPARERLAKALGSRLHARIVWDEIGSCWDTGRRSLLAHDPGSDWALTVQDDAVLCRDFLPGVRAILECMDRRPVGFFFGSLLAAKMRVSTSGPAWIAMEGPWSGVAVALPTEDLSAIVESGNRERGRGKRVRDSYDKRIAKFYGRRGVECFYPIPSLVDHRASRSLMRHPRPEARHAHRFVGEDRSALAIDWTGAPVIRR